MSISTELTRLQQARNTLRTKAVDLGIAQSTAKIDELATAYNGIKDQGAVSAQVQEGDTYTIPKGYHNGSGTVSGVAGGGNYNLQSKTATPTKLQQNITPDSGYYGLSDVTIAAIPENYQDVSSVTAVESDVLATKVFVTAEGEVKAGKMPNNGAVSKKLDGVTKNYTIPAGYHNGSGNVSISVEEKSATPTKAEQTIIPTEGSLLTQVVVNPIPAEYIITTDATAAAPEILTGKTAYVGGSKVVGTMANNGAVKETIDGLSATSYTIPKGYHDGLGTISLTNDIENALAEI